MRLHNALYNYTASFLDGDGTGDDRRLNNIAKMFIKWVSSNEENVEKSKEENQKQYSRLMASLAQCEWIEGKSKLMQNMNRLETENYENLHEKIKEQIEHAESEIKKTKEELAKAKKIRRNRLEYDALAKVINENPDRATQGQKIHEIRAEMESLKAREAVLEDKLESRKKQFHVLVQSIHNLQVLLDEDADRHGGGFETDNQMDMNQTSKTSDDEVMEVA